MTRLSSAAYVTAVLHFLQAYNSGDLDTLERQLDPDVEWNSAVTYTGRGDVRKFIEGFRARWLRPEVRPEDFRELDGRVLMVVSFSGGEATPESMREERQSWVVTFNDDGLIARVLSYPSPAEAARTLEALAQKIPT
jgi:ketosteroid isomerase-like protein